MEYSITGEDGGMYICVGSDGEKEMERRILALPVRDHADSQTLRQIGDVRDIVVATEK